MVPRKPVWNSINRHGPGRHKSSSSRCVWPRGIGALNSSPHSWIFTSVSVGSDPGSHEFTSTTGWIVFTLHQSMVQNPSDMWRSAFEIGVAQCHSSQKLRHHNRSWVWTEALSFSPPPHHFFVNCAFKNPTSVRKGEENFIPFHLSSLSPS